MFSAQVITVRGDISVDRSPTRKPLRVRLATATIDPISSRSTGTRATISVSVPGEVIERRDDVPAIDLRVIEPLHAVIQPVEIAQADGVGGGEQPEGRMRSQDPVLVEQGEFPVAFEETLDDEHDIGAAGVVFVEDEGDGSLHCPGQDAFLEFGDLLAVSQRHRVPAYQVQPAEMSVEVDPHTRPVEPRRDLFDVRGLAGAVQTLHHHPAVAREPGEQGHRHRVIEPVRGIDVGDVVVGFAEGAHLQVGVDSEQARVRTRGWVMSSPATTHLAATSFSISPMASAARRNAGRSLSALSGVSRMTGA